jgi:hypothetical protein
VAREREGERSEQTVTTTKSLAAADNSVALYDAKTRGIFLVVKRDSASKMLKGRAKNGKEVRQLPFALSRASESGEVTKTDMIHRWERHDSSCHPSFSWSGSEHAFLVQRKIRLREREGGVGVEERLRVELLCRSTHNTSFIGRAQVHEPR